MLYLNALYISQIFFYVPFVSFLLSGSLRSPLPPQSDVFHPIVILTTKPS